MATPVNDFQDILDAMERNPALRDLMRSHILGDELMQLPARFIQLQEQVDSIQASVNRLEEGQARLEQGLADTNARIDSLTGEFQTANGRLNNLIGADYESHVATYVHRALRRSKGIHATVLSTQKDKSALARILDEAEFQGLIQPWETDELDNADLVLTAQGPSEYLLAEVSVTVEQEDINRASQRALLLAKAIGRTVTPFAIGAREKPDLQRGDVQVVIIPEPQAHPQTP